MYIYLVKIQDIMRYIEGIARDEERVICFEQMVSEHSIVRLIDVMTHKFYEDNPELLAHPAKGSNQTGRKAYNSMIMMGLLVYGYFRGLAGSRKIEKETHINVEVMWLMYGLRPDHWTICAFRRENKIAFAMIIKMFRRFLVDNEYADASKVVFDGSKMKAYTSRAMLCEQSILKKLKNVEATIKDFLEGMEAIDSIDEKLEQSLRDLEDVNIKKESVEKEVIELEKRDFEKKKESAQKSIEKLLKKKCKLENAKELLENTGEKYISPNDPEAVLVKGRDGKFAGYNIQTGVDEKGHFILSSDVTTQANDQNLMNDNLDSVSEQTGQQPEEGTWDKGYGVANDILKAKQRGVECFVPTPETEREKQAKQGIEFIYDQGSDTYTCSNGKTLTVYGLNVKLSDGSLCDRYRCYECEECPLRDKCTTSKKGRTLKRKHNEAQIQEYKESLKTPKAIEKIKKRKEVVEHPFGTIKILMGKFNFLLIGKVKIQIETNLYSMAYNLKRLISMGEVCLLINKVNEYNWKIA